MELKMVTQRTRGTAGGAKVFQMVGIPLRSMRYLAFLALLTPLFSQSQNKIDVLHYKFEISLSDQNDSLHGKATIKLLLKEKSTNPDLNAIQLDLKNKEGKGKGMVILAPITVGVFTQPLNHKHEKNKLWIYYPENTKAGDTLTLAIQYEGIPTDGLIISKNKFNKKTFFADNWPNRAHHWIPCVDDPADKASVEFLVTAPDNFQVIANGMQVEETNLAGHKKLTHYREDIPLPTKIMVIGVAEFAVQQSGMVNDCIPVSTWVFPENKNEGFPDYSIAPEILRYYINLIGPYAYKKLANIQSKTIFGGMENASAIFYFENSVDGRKDQETLFAHEIVHQWFGNMATEKSFAHLWLSEGFATYLTHMYIESKYGMDSMWNRLRSERKEIIEFTNQSKRPVVDSTTDYMSLLNTNSYQKGSWVLHMLRNKVGDSAFIKSIRKYYAEYAGKNAESKDLQRIFEQVSGKDLSQFFKQWLFTPEHPKLDITWLYDREKKQVNVHVEQLTNTLFDVLVDFALVTNSGAGTRYKAAINKKEQDFYFSMPEKPLQVAIFDMVNLIYEASITQKQ